MMNKSGGVGNRNVELGSGNRVNDGFRHFEFEVW
jgi:hypothetical protein